MCCLCLMHICGHQTSVRFDGSVYHSSCANLWVNRLSRAPPTTRPQPEYFRIVKEEDEGFVDKSDTADIMCLF